MQKNHAVWWHRLPPFWVQRAMQNCQRLGLCAEEQHQERRQPQQEDANVLGLWERGKPGKVTAEKGFVPGVTPVAKTCMNPFRGGTTWPSYPNNTLWPGSCIRVVLRRPGEQLCPFRFLQVPSNEAVRTGSLSEISGCQKFWGVGPLTLPQPGSWQTTAWTSKTWISKNQVSMEPWQQND